MNTPGYNSPVSRMCKTLLNLVIFYAKLLLLESASCPPNSDYIRKLPMDIRSDEGVWIDKIQGSHVKYNPFPAKFHLYPGLNMKIEFRTSDPDGLLFITGNLDVGDLAAAMLSDGYLSFLRHCNTGHTFERYTKKFDDNKWHKLEYIHNRQGGMVEIDEVNPFREYHIGPCTDFSSVLFGGLAADMELDSITGDDTYHRFRGCMRRMRIDGRIAVIRPEHIAVSSCKQN